jgi:hypothetical protein
MAKNDLVRRLNQQFDLGARIGIDIGKQMALDCFQIALHRQGWGYDRIFALTKQAGEVYSNYEGAFDRKNVEADVLREHMDAELADAVKKKGEVVPFEERYPDVYKITYGKR